MDQSPIYTAYNLRFSKDIDLETDSVSALYEEAND